MGRRRSQVVCLGVTAVLAASSAGCGSGDGEAADPQYVGVCVDRSTGVRLDDAVCRDDPLPPESAFTPVPAVDPTASPTAGDSATATPPPTVWTESTPGASPSAEATPGATTTTTSAPSSYHGAHGWYFIPFGMWAPPIGQRAAGGSYTPPAGTAYSRGGMAHTGGSVSSSSVKGGTVTTSRGGFGGSGGKAGS